ncbi:MAG: FTR1 family protein [SAR324 cluster bacterium]|nr:FTR1 family protein [SAR324 cluster bacterium]
MLSSAVIVFREVFEAALIIGIVMAATKEVKQRGLWIMGGVASGLAGACIVAYFAQSIAMSLEGVGQELFNACVLGIAVVMLGWHNIWMSRHGREMAQQMSTVGREVAEGTKSLLMLQAVVAIAVLREGAEVVMFLYGIAAGGSDVSLMMAGGGIGLAGGVVIGVLLYFGLLKVPSRHFFTVTGWLLLLLAAGMASQATVYLVQAGMISPIAPVVWDTSSLLSENSMIGELFHTLIGYDDRPSGIQLIVYVLTLLIIGGLMKRFGQIPAPQKIS